MNTIENLTAAVENLTTASATANRLFVKAFADIDRLAGQVKELQEEVKRLNRSLRAAQDEVTGF